MNKRIATVWLAGCSGCHMSLLDIDERLLDLVAVADLVKCPLVDAKEFPDCDIAMVEGAVATDEHLREIRTIRERSKVLIALGDCAVRGNVPGMRNGLDKEKVLRRAYAEAETNDGEAIPSDPQLGTLLDKVIPLQEAVHVDYFLPGCPPSAEIIFHAVSELLNGREPHLNGDQIHHG